MSILQQQKDLEAFSDQMLAQETQKPSGQYPLFLVASEVQRRADLRERFMQQQQMGQAVAPTILDQRTAEMMQQGLASAPTPPPQGQIPPQMSGGLMQTFDEGGVVRQSPERVRAHQSDRDLLRRYLAQLQQFGRPAIHTGVGSFSPYEMDEEQLRLAIADAQFRQGRDKARWPGIDTLPPAAADPDPDPPFMASADTVLPDRLPEKEPDPGFLRRARRFLEDLVPFWEADWGAVDVPGVGKMDPLLSRRGAEFIDRRAADLGLGTPYFTPAGQAALRADAANWPVLGTAEEEESAPPPPPPPPLPSPPATEAAPPPPVDEEDEGRVLGAQIRQLLGIDPGAAMEQLDILNRNEQVLKEMQREGRASNKEIRNLQDAQRDIVMDEVERLSAETAVEQALSSSMRSPQELAAQRRQRALAGLSGIISGATVVGDVGLGLAGLNENLYQMGEQQRLEQDALSLQAAQAQDERVNARQQLLISQYGADAEAAIAEANRARVIAQTAATTRAISGNAAANILDSATRYAQLTAGMMGLGGQSNTQETDLEILKAIFQFEQAALENQIELPVETVNEFRALKSQIYPRLVGITRPDLAASFEQLLRENPEIAEDIAGAGGR